MNGGATTNNNNNNSSNSDELEEYTENPSIIDSFDRRFKFLSEQSLEVDTTQLQSESYGQDVQRIGWEVSIKKSRSNYRLERMKSYDKALEKNADESKPIGDLCDLESKLHFPSDEKCCFYSFKSNSRQTPCSFTHFQLRHMIATTSPTDVYYMNDNSIHHWNSITRTTQQADGKLSNSKPSMDLRKGHGIVKDLNYMDSEASGVLISTLNANYPYLVAGGFKGEIVVMNLENDGQVVYNNRISHSANSITNYLDLKGNTLLVSSNDGFVRKFDIPSGMDMISAVSFNYCINNSVAQSKNGKLMACIGDTYEVVVCDQEGTPSSMMKLNGHMDFSFAIDWNPTNEYQFCTGSQDKLVCVWDIRKPTGPVHTIPGIIGAIRSVRYSEDGQFLASSEPADFVHVYDVESGFTREHIIDIYGEIVGLAFSRKDGGQSLYVGVYDRHFRSLMELSRYSSRSLSSNFDTLLV